MIVLEAPDRGTCLVTGTGPSFGWVPRELLGSMFTIGVNGSVLADPQPDALVIVDKRARNEPWWSKVEEYRGARFLYRPNFPEPVGEADVLFDDADLYLEPPFDGLFVGQSVIQPALHLAFVLGYGVAVLAGVDGGFVGRRNHFYDDMPADLDLTEDRGPRVMAADRIKQMADWFAESDRVTQQLRGFNGHGVLDLPEVML